MNDQKFLQKWEKNRQKGKRRFYAEMGLAGFIGGILGIILVYAIIGQKSQAIYFSAMFAAIGGMVGGLGGARAGWKTNEKRYEELMQKDKEPNE